MKTALTHLYGLALALWVGGIFLFTFIVTPVIFKSYGRDQAGEIVGRLFPSYFLFTVSVSVVCLILFFFQDRAAPGHTLSLILLPAAVVIALYVSFSLHPQIKEVKQSIASFETVPAEDPLRKRFRSLHGRSAVLNLLMLADGVALLIIHSAIRK